MDRFCNKLVFFLLSVTNTLAYCGSRNVFSVQALIRRHDTQHNDIQQNDTQHNDIQQNDTQHNIKVIATLSIMKLSALC
jgi:hypothetical protein